MAESFAEFADRLERADDVTREKKAIVRQVLKDNSKIIFNGNNYSKEWVQEAEKRGLPIMTNSVDAYEALAAPANVELFEKFNVLSREECHSRQEVLIEGYIKTVEIEAKTLIQIIQRDVLPAVATGVGTRAAAVNALNSSGVKNASLKAALEELADLHADIATGLDALQAVLAAKDPEARLKGQAIHIRDKVLPAMEKVREPCDAAEALVPAENWPLPSYYSLFYRY
jgi:glutamine synthetase